MGTWGTVWDSHLHGGNLGFLLGWTFGGGFGISHLDGGLGFDFGSGAGYLGIFI